MRETSEKLKTEEKKARMEGKQLEEINTRVQEKLESYQELYDSNQRMIGLGRKFDSLAERYFHNKRKKQLLDELMKMVMIENSKRVKLPPKVKKREKAKEKEVLKEVEKKVEVIRERKKKEKEEAEKLPPPKPKAILKVGDRVRMVDGRAVGTIDSLEKDKAFVNYGMFTTQVNVDKLEKV